MQEYEEPEELLEGEFEVDETFIGGKNKNKHWDKKERFDRGRSTKTKTAVFGLLQRNGNVVAMPVETTGQKCLEPEIRSRVKEGSTIYSDEWKAYKDLYKYYSHEIVLHSAKQYAKGNTHSNTIEGFWAILKRGIIGVYHSISKNHLQKYLNEFTYRYNQNYLKKI